MATPETKTLILDAAEKEFAERGFGAVSLRHVISQAGVNLASVHYHFGSKEKLIEAVFERRVGVLTKERLQLLDACEAAAGGAALPLEPVIEALVGPALRLMKNPAGRQFMRLIGHTLAEPSESLRELMHRLFGETVRRFFAAFQRSLPHLPPATLYWRFHFVIGSMGYTMADPHEIKMASRGLCDCADTETAIQELVEFLAAGLRTGAPASTRGRRKSVKRGRQG